MERHTGRTVNPRVEIEKKALVEEEKEDWRNELKSVTSVIVSKTNDLLLKTLKEHKQYTNRSKDLLDEEMAEMKCELDSLKPSLQSDPIMPKRAIVAAPASVGSNNPPEGNTTGRNDSNPHVNGN